MDNQQTSGSTHDPAPGAPTAKATLWHFARVAGIARFARIAGIAATACWATTACGTDEPAHPSPASVGRPTVEAIDAKDAECTSPTCCVAHGARCGGAAACCPGTACVAMADGYFRCAVPCTFDGDCRRGCCALASPDGERVCTGEPCCPGDGIACSS